MPNEPSQQGPADWQPTRWTELAVGKAEIVQPLVSLDPIPSDKLAEACRKAGVLLGKPKVSPATIYNWRNRFLAGGIQALEHKPHRDRGASTLHADLRQFVEDCLKDRKQFSLAEVHRRAERRARDLDLDTTQWPTYDQIRYVDAQLSDAAKIYGQKGARAYRKTHEIVGRFEAEYPNAIWQSDNHLLDILILNPDTNRPERPWLTAVIDDYSRAILGFYLSFADPNSNSIALALHHSMLPKTEPQWVMHGIPELLYVDNGKDFRSKHIAEVCLHFQIDLRSHEPYIARSKGKIESWFKTLEDMCIKHLDGYTGSSPKRRPERVTPKLTLEELQSEIIRFIIETYHRRVHGSTKQRPWERWQDNLKTIQVVEHDDDLDHLLESAERKVQNDGIQFCNQRYVDPAGALTPYIGRKVRIFYNRNDLSTIRVWVRDVHGERFLCQAQAGVAPRDLMAQQKAQRRQLRQDTRASSRRLQAVEKEQTATTNWRTPAPPTIRQRTSAQPPSNPSRSKIIRYQYELEEEEDDAEPNE